MNSSDRESDKKFSEKGTTVPIKYNLTKFDMLSNRVKKLAAAKKDAVTMTKEEAHTKNQATLIASFASGHSWQTSKALVSGTPPNDPEIKKEFVEAYTKKWQTINPFDIVEVSSANIKDTIFSQWLFFNVDRAEHDDYKRAWLSLKGEFNEDCDTIEKPNLKIK